ncbi:MAG TPA: hypothetical protein VK158_03270 [Acidobacteriota bacterium]|nr:hypothetical protein [Acidobacteriota bacterium]
MKRVWLVLALVILSGCTTQQAECITNTDCPLPMEYATRSSCPFSSVCDAGQCRVVCFDAYHDPNPDVSKSYPVMCEYDGDCSCKYFGASDPHDCRCVQGQCAAVMQ